MDSPIKRQEPQKLATGGLKYGMGRVIRAKSKKELILEEQKKTDEEWQAKSRSRFASEP
jgi:hypothetical protein